MGTPSRSLPPLPRPRPSGRPPREPGKGCVVSGFAGCLIAILAVVAGIIGLWRAGKGAWEEEVGEALRDDEMVVKHLGRLEDVEVDFGHTMALEGDDLFVFRLTGTRGTGLARLQIDDSDGVRVVAGTLQLEDGSTVKLLDAWDEQDEEGAEEEVDEQAMPPPRREPPAGRVRTAGGWVEPDESGFGEPEPPAPSEETVGEPEPPAEPAEEPAPEEGGY